MRAAGISIGVVATLLLFWLMWPVPISPVYWDEPEPPAMTGAYSPDNRLGQASFFPVGALDAAEGVAIGPDGALYFGTATGHIQRLTLSVADHGWQIEEVAKIADTPIMGLKWQGENRLGIAANAGLYALDIESHQIDLLSAGATSHPFGYVNDLAVMASGHIYFTDSSTRWGHGSDSPGYFYDMLENRPNGLLYVWNPDTRQTHVVVDRLYYPNGVVAASDGRSVFISETFRYRILRLWLQGEQAGQLDVFADNLPGLPDGLMTDGDGTLYIAMLRRRSDLLRFVHRNPFWTRILFKLPAWLQPAAGTPGSFVLTMDESTGQALESYHDGTGRVGHISNLASSGDGRIWFGTSLQGVVGYFDLDPAEHEDDSGTDPQSTPVSATP